MPVNTLAGYRSQTQTLLDDTGAVEYSTTALDTFINDARVQIALSSESIRQPGSLAMVASQRNYAFSSISFIASPSSTAGLAGVGDVRGGRLVLPNNGYRRLETRAWEWFNTFWLAVPVPATGAPTIFTRLQPGILGTLWVAPLPDAAYTLHLDTVAYPASLLTDDSVPETLQYPWTESVQYFAAYMALMSAQRYADADRLWARYMAFEGRGTQMTTPSRLPAQYPGGAGAAVAGTHLPITAQRGQGR